MKVALAYIAVTHGPDTSDYCARFVATWLTFPPGADCDLWVVCNGGPLSTAQNLMFAPLQPRVFVRVNDGGYDISAFQDAAHDCCKDYDALLCMGQSIHFTRADWLKRALEVWQRTGEGFYGFFASNNVRAHLQTSAFLTSPRILRSYPARVLTRPARYEFEHGERALWRRVYLGGWPVRCITWDGDWGPKEWREPANILWRGTQENLLFANNHAQGWADQPPVVQSNWSALADGVFR